MAQMRVTQAALNDLCPLKLVYDATHYTVVLHFGWPRRKNLRLCALNRMHWLDDDGNKQMKMQLHIGGAGQDYEGLTKDLPHHRANEGIDARPRPVRDMFRLQAYNADGTESHLLKIHPSKTGLEFAPDFFRRDVLQGSATVDLEWLRQLRIRMPQYNFLIPSIEVAQEWIETRNFGAEQSHTANRRRNYDAKSTYTTVPVTQQRQPKRSNKRLRLQYAVTRVAPTQSRCGMCNSTVRNRNVGEGFNARTGLYCNTCHVATCATCIAVACYHTEVKGAPACFGCAKTFTARDVGYVVHNADPIKLYQSCNTPHPYYFDLRQAQQRHDYGLLINHVRMLSRISRGIFEMRGQRVVPTQGRHQDPVLRQWCCGSILVTDADTLALVRELQRQYPCPAIAENSALPLDDAVDVNRPQIQASDVHIARSLADLCPPLDCTNICTLLHTLQPTHLWFLQGVQRFLCKPLWLSTVASLFASKVVAWEHDVSPACVKMFLVAQLHARQLFKHRSRPPQLLNS